MRNQEPPWPGAKLRVGGESVGNRSNQKTMKTSMRDADGGPLDLAARAEGRLGCPEFPGPAL
jgi:hypothetical protein